jgi:hypothetical protein
MEPTERKQMNVGIFSLYWDNIDPKIPYYQKAVFDHLNLPMQQHKIHGIDHGEWMDWVLERNEDVELMVFFDIDCIPLNRDKAVKRIESAMGGVLVGNEQASNHLDPSRLFAAPSFLCVLRRIWKQVGKPSCKAHYDGDVAQMLTDTWNYRGLPVDLLPVKDFEVAKWDLPDRPQSYGIGTNYDDTTYHLFEVRENVNVDRFVAKAKGVLN